MRPVQRIARGTLALGLHDDPLGTSIVYGAAGRDNQAAIAEFSAAVESAPESVLAWRGLAMANRLA